jgi:hypothetical protein
MKLELDLLKKKSPAKTARRQIAQDSISKVEVLIFF